MIETIDNAIQTVASWFDLFGVSLTLVVAVVVGTVASWCGTQVFKFLLPLLTRWRAEAVHLHGWGARVTAFLIGMIACLRIAGDYSALNFWVAFCVGVLSPVTYQAAKARFPWMVHLSGDKSANHEGEP